MNSKLRVVGALSKKYFLEVVTNPALLVCCLMPVILMALMNNVLGGAIENDEHSWEFKRYLTAASLVFVAAMVPSSATLFPMSEERDKRTLRTLLFAGVTMEQITAARGIVGMLIVVIANMLCYFVIGTSPEVLPLCMLLGILGSISLVLLSLALGIISRDQMTSSFYCLPLVLAGVMPTLFWYSAELTQAIPFLPTGGAFILIDLTLKGNLFTTEALLPAIATLAWIILSAIVLTIMIKRAPRDA